MFAFCKRFVGWNTSHKYGMYTENGCIGRNIIVCAFLGARSIWTVQQFIRVYVQYLLLRCYGINLTFPQMLTIVLTATLVSIGTAGVPGSGMMMLTMVLTSVGLPIEGIALVAGVDRIFDMEERR